MPALYGGRRIEQSEMQAEGVKPVEVYSPTTRYAISLLGIVVAVQVLPNGVQPLLQLGQLATVSATLKVGDTV